MISIPFYNLFVKDDSKAYVKDLQSSSYEAKLNHEARHNNEIIIELIMTLVGPNRHLTNLGLKLIEFAILSLTTNYYIRVHV